MVNRIQTLRSSTSGARPAGRQPGELYVNWPDLQLGVVDSASAPVDLIAVRYFSTLTSYAVGDFAVQAGLLYVANTPVTPGPFNPAQWTAMKTVLDPPVGGPYLPLIGGTLSGALIGTSLTLDSTLSGVNAVFQGIIQSMREQITNVAGTARSLTGATSLNPRWQMNLGDATPESGANAGSNFALLAYADDGSTLLSTPLAVNRATGAVTLAGSLNGAAATFTGALNGVAATLTGSLTGTTASFGSVTLNGAAGTFRSLLFETNAVPRWALYANNSAESGANAGSDFGVNLYNDAGVFISTPFQIARSTGAVVLGAHLIQASSIDQNFEFQNAAFATRMNLSWASVDSSVNLTNIVSGAGVSLPGNGSFVCTTDAAQKPSGGAWATISDARIKIVQGEYALGLDEVLQLRPVAYVYKGNDTPTANLNTPLGRSPNDPTLRVAETAPYPASYHYAVAKDEKPFVGLIAQEVEAVFPGMVTQKDGFIDGQSVTDLRSLDPSELVFALVNAVKTLTARVQVLEQAVIPR